MTRTHDVLVLGATPAGLAAASYLASRKLDVAVVSAPHQAIECPLADWVPKDFFSYAHLPKSLATSAKAEAFKRVVYHNAELTKDAEYSPRGTAGYLVRYESLVKALRTACTKAGVKVTTEPELPAIRLEEDRVRLLDSHRTSGKLLIVAQDRPEHVITELGLPARTVPRSSLVIAGLDIPLPRRGMFKSLAGALHVMESRERSELGLFFVLGNVMHLRVISDSMASGTRAAEMSTMVAKLQQAEILPADLPLAKAQGAVWRPPSSVALELETHVAKRTLLAGTAGGFSESITGQTLAPSVKSALLAADVAMEALKGPDVQEKLMQYKTSWRESLADYLRPPNTSLHMLLPLLFVNKRIVSKFTHALLYGETI